jgi:hypothetical protein
MGICPHCNADITQLDIEVISLSDITMSPWRGLSYSCPACRAVLSASFDPVALEGDLVKALVKALRTG